VKRSAPVKKKAPAKKAPAMKTLAKKSPAKKKAPAKKKSPAKKTAPRRKRSVTPAARNIAALRVREIDALREELETKRANLVPRWNADPEDVQKSVAQLVLALVELLRKLLERQAIRRMDAETLTPAEVERIGVALMRLEETVHELARRFGLDPEELNLDLGPLGRLS
jgi:hypothetical protein